MPSSLPRSVREAWGDEATDDFERWLEATLQDRAVPRDEYREVLSRLDVLENDVEHVQAGLANLRTDVQDLRSEMNERFDRVNERFDQLYDRMLVTMRWTVGTIALFGTLITVLLAIAEFT
jgi:tetrahydromethanopterin S-methyltransferase subunit G